MRSPRCDLYIGPLLERGGAVHVIASNRVAESMVTNTTPQSTRENESRGLTERGRRTGRHPKGDGPGVIGRLMRVGR
jgi:hypothetical protein